MSGLRAGAAKAIITPSVGYPMGDWALGQGLSTGANDHLYAKALVLGDDARQIGIVALDLTGIAKETVGGIRTRAASYCSDYIRRMELE